jgi:hypothetical protein
VKKLVRTVTAVVAIVVALGVGSPAEACSTHHHRHHKAPAMVTYTFSTDEAVAKAKGITYQDNTDFESDNPQYCSHTLTVWTCTVPASMAPVQ